jgi:hypothetical protein
MGSEQNSSALHRITRTIAGIVEECNYAQRRLLELQADPERYVLPSWSAPDTYADFLARTCGQLVHEPSAADRAFWPYR